MTLAIVTKVVKYGIDATSFDGVPKFVPGKVEIELMSPDRFTTTSITHDRTIEIGDIVERSTDGIWRRVGVTA